MYWNANIEHPGDYKDLEKTPDAITSMPRQASRNSVHLARHLAEHQYPPSG